MIDHVCPFDGVVSSFLSLSLSLYVCVRVRKRERLCVCVYVWMMKMFRMDVFRHVLLMGGALY